MMFKVYKSSAGSGKTFTLVKEFIKLCLANTQATYFSRILAITFTNKATAEMKERVLNQLEAFEKGKEDAMSDLIAAELGISFQELQAQSAKVISQILHQYGDFSISTIDQFTHRLIRTFAKDLNLPLKFMVAIEHEELMEKTIFSLINEVGANTKITSLLTQFLYRHITLDKSWRIENELLHFANQLINENSFYYLQSLKQVDDADFEESRKSLNKKVNHFLKELAVIGKEGLKLIRENNIPHDHFTRGLIPKFFKSISNPTIHKIEVSKTVVSSYENLNWYPKRLNNADAAQIDGISEPLSQLLERYFNLIETDYKSALAAFAILEKMSSLALIQEIESRFDKIKKEENVIHISEFNKRVSEVVLNEPMPFIYERIGERYKHIMIDEFQDTSILQFVNLLPLLEESLSQANFNMIVGDAKQAIYRFRGGVSEQFAKMPEIDHLYEQYGNLVSERLGALKSNYQEAQLAVNRRSKANVISFNNEFFQFAFNHSLIHAEAKVAFQEVKQEIANDDGKGYVQVELFKKEELKENQLSRIETHIKEAIESKYQLKDIAILCRIKSQATLVAEHLKSQSIAVLSSEALLLNASSEVNILISVLRWCVNPENVIAKVKIIKYLVQQEEAEQKAMLLSEYVGMEEGVEKLFEKYDINLNRELLIGCSLFSLFEEIIRQFQFNKSYDVYIQFFQDLVFEYAQKEGNHFPSFIEYWEKNESKLALSLETEMNAIRIMTIHKSKGLEFPVTIIPFLSQDSSSHNNSDLWVKVPVELNVEIPYALIPDSKRYQNSLFEKELEMERIKRQEDFLNDNYVGFTRAVDRLYLLVDPIPQKRDDSPIGIHHLLHDFVISKGEENILELGLLEDKEEKQKVDREEELFRLTYISEAWQNKLVLSTELTAFYQEEETEKAIAYGNLLHEILSKIKAETDINRVLNMFYLKGRITQEEKIDYKTKLERLIQNEEISPYFQNDIKVFRELSLYNSNGEVLRPDRIVKLKDGNYFILEYKTGQELEAHKKQLLDYIFVLKEATQSEVGGALVYVEEEKMIRV